MKVLALIFMHVLLAGGCLKHVQSGPRTGGGGGGGSTGGSSGGSTTGNYEPAPLSTSATYYTDLKLNFTALPPTVADLPARYAANVAYGEDAQQRFDIFLPESSTPTPLVIFIHGGGFTSGDKSAAYELKKNNNERDIEVLKSLIGKNVAFATINYRLLQDNDREGVLKSLSDSRYCLQFIRYHADKFNINPNRIALYGKSAGAGTSLWIALQDDLADKGNSNPVLRESTRVQAVVASETQSTYDIVRWTTDVFKGSGLTIDRVKNTPAGQRLGAFYGISDMSELESPRIEKYRRQVDMLAMLSADDPEIYVRNTQVKEKKPGGLGGLLHHADHARALKEFAEKGRTRGQYLIPAYNVTPAQLTAIEDFLAEKLR